MVQKEVSKKLQGQTTYNGGEAMLKSFRIQLKGTCVLKKVW
jgi:hypothetical protein